MTFSAAWFAGATAFVARSHRRLRIQLMADLRKPDGEEAAIYLRNLSCSGFMGESETRIGVGTKVHLILRNGRDIPAVARWSVDNKIGFEIVHPLGLTQLLKVLLSAGKGLLLKEAVVPALLIAVAMVVKHLDLI
jgi:hypothetical protein